MFLESIAALANAAGGGLMDIGQKRVDDISQFKADPKAAIKQAWQNSPAGRAMQNPQVYMEQRIQAVLAGKIPPTADDLKMIDLMRRMPPGAQLPMGGFIRQNPQFLNSAQQGIVR